MLKLIGLTYSLNWTNNPHKRLLLFVTLLLFTMTFSASASPPSLSDAELFAPSTVPNFKGYVDGQLINGQTITTANPTINCTWSHAYDPSGIDKYHIILQKNPPPRLISEVVSYPATSFVLPSATLQDGITYSIHIRAKSNNGVWGPYVNGGSFTVDLTPAPDTTPPPHVPNFTVRINNQIISNGQIINTASPSINFSWSHPFDPSGIERYQVVIARVGVGWIHSNPNILYPQNAYFYPASNLVDGATYATYIRAKDNAGNWRPTFFRGPDFKIVLPSAPSNRWSDPMTWSPLPVPSINSSVTIDPGKTVILDVNVDIKNLTIHGILIADQTKNLNLSTNWILVQGNGALLQWGTASAPYTKQAVITLKHAPDDIIEGPTMKFLAARGGGQVEIHGANNKKSWTQLAATVNKNTKVITLKENPGWVVGDTIVIASTDFDAHQAEVRRINGVSNGGKTLTLNANLNYMHWGALKSYKNGSYTLDERAEVGLLSRNITIQGDAESEDQGIGGHTMFMPNSVVHISGTKFYRMGQRDSLARYPFHWHVAENVNGQYIKNCSIHRSFNRVVTVHGTNYALVENNVGYDHIGHGYFLEDGNEIRNTFRNNLGILTRAPAPGKGVTPHDRVIGNVPNTHLLKLPATFWITNPENYFVGNVAAGSEGSGFWMVVLNNTLGEAAPINPQPGKRPLLQFEDNKGHSNSFSNFSIDGSINRTTNEMEYGFYAPVNANNTPSIPQIIRFTGYKVRERNVWTRGRTMHFRNCVLADSPRNTFFAFNQILFNSLIVGKSLNVGSPVSNNEMNALRSLAHPNRSATSDWNVFSGHTIYDGPSGMSTVHLADFFGNNATAFNTNAAAQKSTAHFVEGITFENVPESNKVWFGKASHAETFYCSGMIDRDGSVTGIAGAHITPQISAPNASDTKIREEGFNIEVGAQLRSDWDAYLNTNEHFGLLRTRTGFLSSADMYPTYNIRSDGPATYGQPINTWNMNPVIVNDANLKYYWQYHRIPNLIKPHLLFVNQNDYMISAFTNMPSSSYVYKNASGSTPLEQATSLSQLISSTTQKYFFKDNTIYVKHAATKPQTATQYVQGFSYISPEFRICQFQNCANSRGRTTDVTFADFEMDMDSRARAYRSGDLPLPVLSMNNSNPNDKGISWQMESDGDATNEYTQVKFEFPRQVWTDFNYLIINISGVSKFRVYTRDLSQSFKNLGLYSSGNQVVIPLNSVANKDFLDEVHRLIIRVYETYMGSTSATINLFDIKLSLTAPLPPESTIGRWNSTTDIDELHRTADLHLYPNPAQDIFNLEMDFARADELHLEIFDLTGRKMGSYKQQVPEGEWKQVFSTEQFGLSPGMYQLRIRTRYHGIKVANLAIPK